MQEHTGSGIASLILAILGFVIGIMPVPYELETLAGAVFLVLLFGLISTGLGAQVRKKDPVGKAGMILGIILLVLGFFGVIWLAIEFG